MITPQSPVDAVLFIGFGGPDKMADVMPFLEIVTKGRPIPKERLLEVAQHYERMGGASPINAITRRQADALKNELAAQAVALPVYIGQRNWHPFLEDALRRMAADGIKHAVGFITAAHRSEPSLERYIAALEGARERVGAAAPLVDSVDPWFDHPLFIEALVARTRDALAKTPAMADAPWYFIAHSIPCCIAKESTYVEELERTAALVAGALGKESWRMAYSSRSGRPTDPWLVPDVNQVIRDEARRGTKNILFITIGFMADHVEVLFDQDIEAQATAREAGVRLERSSTVGDHPLFIRMIADVIQKRIHGTPRDQQLASTSTVFRDGRVQACVGQAAARCFCFPDASHPPCLASNPSGRPTAHSLAPKP